MFDCEALRSTAKHKDFISYLIVTKTKNIQGLLTKGAEIPLHKTEYIVARTMLVQAALQNWTQILMTGRLMVAGQTRGSE